MNVGRFDIQITLLRPVSTTNAFGEETLSYEETISPWANRATYTGRSVEEVGEHFADYSAEYYVNSCYEVAEGWRIIAEGVLYEVRSVLFFRRSGLKKIIAERVNE